MSEIKTRIEKNRPVIVINYKTYRETSGMKGLRLAKIAEKLASEFGVCIAVCPQVPDLAKIAGEVVIPVYSQHMDAYEPGAYTGHITGEILKEIGCAGTLLNHSEKRMQIADIEAAVSKANSLGLLSILCTNNINVSVASAAFSPSYIAIEPPELIGGDISVTSADPDIILGTVTKVREINHDSGILCGAGVKNGDDVYKAIQLGTNGVLLASGVAKAKDPYAVLTELLQGILKL